MDNVSSAQTQGSILDADLVGADFQQAKNHCQDARFLQIKAKKEEHKLTRVAFRVSRLTEFCSLKELQN